MELALPNLHPAVVHFPIVLVIVALVLDLGALIRAASLALDRAAALVWTVAALSAAAAWLAGRRAASGLVDVPAQAQAALAAHADLATAALVTASLVALGRLALMAWDPKRDRSWGRPARLAWLIPAVILQGLVVLTADRGGALVYVHGLAVARDPVQPVAVAPPPSPVTAGDPLVRLQAEGSLLSWSPTALGALTTQAPPAWLSATPVTGTVRASARLAVSGRQTLMLPLPEGQPPLGDLQLNVWLDLADLQGEVSLLHHVGDDVGGAFTLTTTGRAGLATIGPAEEVDVLDERATALPGRVALAVSSAGQHRKGIVDGKTVAHGHGAALEPGLSGILFAGEGVVGIQRIELIPLQDP